jgi:ribosome-binding protein aMBF1 (putative translation factor)
VAYERVARGWSRKRLAAMVGIDEATVRRIEKDAVGRARGPILPVRRALGIDL